MKTENITKYMCDCCGKTEYIPTKETSPMQQYRLPMRYITETGRDAGYTNQCVDLCKDCLRDLASTISQHYELYSVAYGGVVMKRRAENGKRNDN